jgi:hypothetical protein
MLDESLADKVAYFLKEKHAKIAYFMIAVATACLLGLLGK